MKQIILSCILLLSTTWLNAQQIMNAGFENWTWVGGWYENPDGWNTNNTQLQVVVVKDYNPYHGAYNMLVHHDGRAWHGAATTQHPSALNLFYRSTIISGDTVGIVVRLYNAGAVVDSGRWMKATSQQTWTPLSIPLSQTSNTVDSFSIHAYNNGVPGTMLLLDDLSFGPILNVGNIPQISWQLYPNPLTDNSVLRVDNPLPRSSRFTLTDMYGRLLHAREVSGNEIIIDKEGLAAGVYLFYLTAGNKTFITGKLSVL